MKYALRITGMLAALYTPVPAFATAEPEQSAQDFLEGVWMIGKPPTNPVCVEGDDSTYQFEFEFRKTGGRLQHYEPFDVFGAGPLGEARRNGDEITVALPAYLGRPEGMMEFHIQTPDRVEMHLARQPGAGAQNTGSEVLYRCGAPDRAVNAGVALEQLQVLTSPKSTEIAFREALDGASDAESCEDERHGDKPSRRNEHWLQFEVFGPVHFYLMGTIGDPAWHSKLELSPIRSITAINAKTMKLEILERLPGGHGWSGGAQVRPYTLTVVWDGRHIIIPEMNKTFVRCRTIDHETDTVPAPLP